MREMRVSDDDLNQYIIDSEEERKGDKCEQRIQRKADR